jgi:hypothetical protein
LSATESTQKSPTAAIENDAVSATLEEDEDEPVLTPAKKKVITKAVASDSVQVEDSDDEEPLPTPKVEAPAPVIPPLEVPVVDEKVASEPEVPAAPTTIKKKTVIKKK